jgi:hypothetical protein
VLTDTEREEQPYHDCLVKGRHIDGIGRGFYLKVESIKIWRLILLNVKLVFEEKNYYNYYANDDGQEGVCCFLVDFSSLMLMIYIWLRLVSS